jgi:hypothetical protein
MARGTTLLPAGGGGGLGLARRTTLFLVGGGGLGIAGRTTLLPVGGGGLGLARRISFFLVGGGGLGMARRTTLLPTGDGGGLGMARRTSFIPVGGRGGGQRLTFRTTFPVSFVGPCLSSAPRGLTEARPDDAGCTGRCSGTGRRTSSCPGEGFVTGSAGVAGRAPAP